MRIQFISNILAGIALCVCASCSDWTELEAEFEEDLRGTNKSEEYYEALRAYKKSDHLLSFAWIGNISHGGTDLEKSYLGMPDSLDIVSIWQGVQSDEYWSELRYCQQKLGTRFLRCRFASKVPEEYGWTEYQPADPEKDPEKYAIMEKAIQAYANALCDEIDENGLDGLDIDYEPTVGGPEAKGNLGAHQVTMEIWIKELGKRLGPQSGTEKLLTVDGEISHRNLKNLGKYFSYFISQAYNSSSESSLDNRLRSLIQCYTTSTVDPITIEECVRKLIVTENFESLASTGGRNFTDRDGNKMNSLKGMALYQPYYNGEPIEGINRIAGFGAFHLEYEYNVSGKAGHYPYMREAIQSANPAGK